MSTATSQAAHPRAAARVLVVIETLGYGGAEQALVVLLPALAERGLHVEVAALWAPYELAGELEKRGITVHRLDLPHRWAAFHALGRLSALVDRGHFQVVWGHLYFATLYARLVKLVRPRLRVISSLHSLAYSQFPARAPWHRFRKALDRWTGRWLSDRLVAVSRVVADDYGRHLGWSRPGEITVVHNAVSTPAMAALAEGDRSLVRARHGIPADHFALLLPGRYTDEKGHAATVGAVKLLRDRGVPVHLTAVGAGPLRASVESLVGELRLGEQVQLLDPVPQSELFQLMQGVDAVVTPSTFEGCPVAASEAMGLGALLIASTAPGFLELAAADSEALLVPASDVEAIAGAIQRAAENPELRLRLGRAARARVGEQLGLDRIAEEWERIFEDVLKDG